MSHVFSVLRVVLALPLVLVSLGFFLCAEAAEKVSECLGDIGERIGSLADCLNPPTPMLW